MQEPSNSELGAALSALAIKYGSGVVGALLSLRFQPAEATLGDKLWALVGGMSAVIWGVPGAVELLEVTQPGMIGLMGLVAGCVGMTALSTLSAAIRDIGLGALVADLLRGWLRIGKRGGDGNG